MGRLPLVPFMKLTSITSPGRQLGQEVPSQEIPQSFPHVPSLGTPSQAPCDLVSEEDLAEGRSENGGTVHQEATCLSAHSNSEGASLLTS